MTITIYYSLKCNYHVVKKNCVRANLNVLFLNSSHDKHQDNIENDVRWCQTQSDNSHHKDDDIDCSVKGTYLTNMR